MKLVFFGDSITDMSRNRETADGNVHSYGKGFVFLVAAELLGRNPKEYTVVNRGFAGDHIYDLYARLKRDVWNEEPDVVTILIGINDVEGERNPCGTSDARFEKIYRMLIEETREKVPNVQFILCAPFHLYVSEEKCPQGVLAVVNKPNKDLVSPNGKCLLLDGVSDPSNVGAILRTAAAAGYNEVYMTDDSADAYSNKAVRASMTGVLRVNVMRAPRERLLEVINVPLWIADMNGESVFTAKPNGDFCLVIGNEGNGVSRQVKDKASFTVSIPMDNGVESLNAAVSAGILMYNLKNKV
jgi:tRNA G18 (ribose-2'-O)-methylase SpoU